MSKGVLFEKKVGGAPVPLNPPSNVASSEKELHLKFREVLYWWNPCTKGKNIPILKIDLVSIKIIFDI